MDAVVTYVDGSDPQWLKEYAAAVGESLEPKRFRDWGLLRYLLRGISTYMPFVENVYLVVSGEGQVPSWLSSEVKVVYHRDIIPEEFLPVFQHYYEVLFDGHEKVEVGYASRLDQKPLEDLLKESLPQDLHSTYTNVGIHKDDLEFRLGGHPLKRVGSQGQQKSFVVAIRLAQFEYNYQKIGYKPILLLDDVFDKLDDQRVRKLVQLVGDNHFGQVFVTDTQRQRIESLFEDTDINYRIFEVEAGKVSLIDHE